VVRALVADPEGAGCKTVCAEDFLKITSFHPAGREWVAGSLQS